MNVCRNNCQLANELLAPHSDLIFLPQMKDMKGIAAVVLVDDLVPFLTHSPMAIPMDFFDCNSEVYSIHDQLISLTILSSHFGI